MTNYKMGGFVMLVFFSLSVITCSSMDTMNLTQSLKDGETLISSGGNFELGFFSPGTNGNRYVAIWFKKVAITTYVWVANRERPVPDSSGILKLSNRSVLQVVNAKGEVFWSTNLSRSVQNPIAQLLDTGNLVVKDKSDSDPNSFLWQSFDYPCNSQLPKMMLGLDRVTGFERNLTSWKSSDDPAKGSYTYRIDLRGYPQPFLMQDSVVIFRDGPWNGVWFTGASRLDPNPIYGYQFIFNEKEVYYVYELLNSSVISDRILNPTGLMQRVEWNTHTEQWATYLSGPSDNCDTYALCGQFGSCNMAKSPECGCLDGFQPKNQSNWVAGDWVDGCIRKTQLNCSERDGFMKYENVKLPDTRYAWYNTSMTLEQCKHKCLQNCSCVGYANLYVTNGGTGCLIWIDVLIDIKVFSANGQDLYVRMAGSEFGGGKKKAKIAATATAVVVFVFSVCLFIFVCKRRSRKRKAKTSTNEEQGNHKKGEPELPVFEFNEIADATNGFSDSNKLGEGGFGPVYKGVLNGGQEIAVKRLSKDSRQGIDEFKNEVICIVKLQHRNLVKLLGCCIEAEECLLVYEYMPNKSLDFFIFDQTRSKTLDWPKRFDIIKGIARGLLYLHQDSRLRIVHRDLKASNILLDFNMNPKISDFGMARSFEGLQHEARTKRVVGTYGYMSPEYAIDGLFSLKSDVFSFGVLVLEIVSGRRNRGFIHPDHHHNLLGHAWTLYNEGVTLEMADPSIRDSNYKEEILRTTHIGMLCVQQHPDDRPSMSLVTVMLNSDSNMPEPKQPGFYVPRHVVNKDSSSSNTGSSDNNKMTITLLSGR